MKTMTLNTAAALIVSATLALASAAGWASGEREGLRGGHGSHRAALAGLDLDQAQREAVEALFAEHRERLAALGRDREARQAERARLIADLRAVLDPAQRERFDQRLAERQARREAGQRRGKPAHAGALADAPRWRGGQCLRELELSETQRAEIEVLLREHRQAKARQRAELHAAIRELLDDRQRALWDARQERDRPQHHGRQRRSDA